MTDLTNKAPLKPGQIKVRLASYAAQQHIPYDRVLTLFLLDRAAHRLTLDEVLVRSLVFKGGFVNVRVYSSPRHTTDLDAVLNSLDHAAAERLAKAAMERELADAVWFRFTESVDLKTQNEYGGLRLIFRSGLGEMPAKLERAQLIHIDLGTGDPVTPGPVALTTPFTLGGGSLSWQVYPVETMLAEKLHALITLGERNSRSKDVFDIVLLLPKADRAVLVKAIHSTFTYRGDLVPVSASGTLAAMDRSQLQRGWASAVGSVSGSRSFDETLAIIIAKLGEWGI